MTADYGRGFSEKNLRHMIRFAELFSDRETVSALSRQLGWTHFRALIYIDDPLRRELYAEMCRVERWSTRTLKKKLGSMLFERTGSHGSPMSWPGGSWPGCARRTVFRRTWSFATRTSWAQEPASGPARRVAGLANINMFMIGLIFFPRGGLRGVETWR